MEKKIKIGFVIDTIVTPMAGTEKQLLMLLNNIDRNKFEPYLICLYQSEWMKDQNFDFPVKYFDFGSIISLGFIKNMMRLIKFIKIEKFDIIQTFFKEGNMFGTIAAKIAGCKTIISSRRNLGEGYWHNRKSLFILKLLSKITHLYISNSKMVAEYTIKAEKVNGDKMAVINNGLYLDNFELITPELRQGVRQKYNINPNEIVIGIVANLRPIKNISLLIEAANILQKKFSNIRLLIIGEGDERKKLEKMINGYKLTDKVILAGEKKDIVPYLSAMDIAVLCSKAESFSNSIIEYMAAGLPSVVSNVGGNPEIIGNDCGYIFKSGDQFELSDKLGLLIENREIRIEMGKISKSKAFDNYDYRKIVKQHQETYENIYKRLPN